MKRETIAKILAVVITVVLIAILLSQISIGDIAKTLVSIEPIYLIIGFVLYIFSYFFRTLRFYILLNNKVYIKHLFPIICVHNIINNILPARTGELSYIYMLKKLHNKSTGEGIATLMVARVFDYILISFFFFISALYVGYLPNVILKVIWTIAVFLVLVILMLITSVYFGDKFLKIVEKIAVRLNLNKFRIITFLLKKGWEAKECFRMMRSKKKVFHCFLVSIMIWCSLYSMTYVLLKGMHLNLTIWLVILGITIVMLLNLLPVHGICKFGTYEGTWTVIFISLGLSKEVAITSGFSVHIISIIYFLILGCYGLFMLKFRES